MPICATRPPGKHARHSSAVSELGQSRLAPQDGLREPFQAVEPALHPTAQGISAVTLPIVAAASCSSRTREQTTAFNPELAHASRAHAVDELIQQEEENPVGRVLHLLLPTASALTL